MIGLKRYLDLTVRSKIGIDSAIVTSGLIAVLCIVATFVWVVVAAFLWLSDRYSSLTAAIILLVVFFLLAISAALISVMARKRLMASAKRELAQQRALSSVVPGHLTTVMNIANGVGWRRIVLIAGAGFLAAGLVREWVTHRRENIA